MGKLLPHSATVLSLRIQVVDFTAPASAVRSQMRSTVVGLCLVPSSLLGQFKIVFACCSVYGWTKRGISSGRRRCATSAVDNWCS